MTIRRLNPADLPFLLNLEQTYCDIGFLGSDDSNTHERQMSDGDCLYLLVEDNDAPAGYVILRGLKSKNQCVELKRIAITTPGHGLGRRVLSAVIKRVFEEYSAHRLWLDVFVDNDRARHLYRSLGFTEEGTLRECVKHEDRYRSLVIMSILSSEYVL